MPRRRHHGRMTPSAAYSVHPTPIGEALVVTTDEGLAVLHLLEIAVGAREAALAEVSAQLRAVPVPDGG